MFNSIEAEFSSNSKLRRFGSVLVFMTAVIMVLIFFVIPQKITELYVKDIFIFAGCYYLLVYVIFFISAYHNEYKWNLFIKFFSVNQTISKFKSVQDKHDEELMIRLLKDNKINTRARVANIIDHYRAFLPRYSRNDILFPLVAICISIGAFLYDNQTEELTSKFSFIGALLVLALLSYIIYNEASNILSNFFSKKALYIRMESVLTKIYIDGPFK